MKKIYTFILLFYFLALMGLPLAYSQCRSIVVDDYITNYSGSATSQADMGWTGNASTCTAGTISATALSKTLQRLNYYRRLTGLNANVTFDATMNAKSQASSLMMQRNQALNHAPPSTWLCYTANGFQAASQGNLAIGSYGAGDIDLWMDDSRTPSVGHRRWILAPNAAKFGYGSVKGTGSYAYAGTLMWGGGMTNPNTTPPSGYIQYPVAGYMPKDLISTLWSFGTPNNNGNFSSASISVTDDSGNPVSITINPVEAGYGNSSTIVWNMPAIDKTDPVDRVYTVKISNFSVNGVPQNPYTYKVVAIQPKHAGVQVTTTGSVCNNGTATASFEPGYKSILWSTGATTASVSGLAPGNYSVQVTDKNNCAITKQVTVPAVSAGTVPNPAITAAGTTSFCGAVSATALSVANNSSYSSFQWLKDGSPVSGATGISYSATTPGNYSLKVTTCQGANLTSNTIPFLVYNAANIAAGCTFTSGYSGSNSFGIQNFTFNTINHTSGSAGAEGIYVDNTCSQSTIVAPSQSYTFSLKSYINGQSAKVFIDYNNNGTFEPAEQVYSGSYAATHTGSVTIPGTAVQNIPLRVRVIADFSSASTITGCHINGYSAFSGSGQAEDYSLIISGALPVTLISFHGKVISEGVKLSWTTTSEFGNDYFEVQRSNDLLRFETIDKMDGLGTATLRHDYTWIDTSLPTSTVFYRLKQVDFDGTSAYSRIISIEPKPGDNGVVLGPNPVIDHIIIYTDINNAVLCDLNGHILQKLNKGYNSLSAYSSGIYLIRYDKGGILKSFSIMKQ